MWTSYFLGVLTGAALVFLVWLVRDIRLLRVLRWTRAPQLGARPNPTPLPPGSHRSIERARRAARLPLPAHRRPGIIPLAPLRDFKNFDEETTK